MADIEAELRALVRELREQRETLAAEFGLLLAQVKRERRALFEIVIKHGDLPMLHEIADMLEQQKTLNALSDHDDGQRH